MDINVTVENINLDDYIDSHYDTDGDRVPGGTLADAIVRQLVDKSINAGTWKGVIERVQAIRDDEIRAQLAPVVAEALEKPIKRTNTWGEKTGEDTTLREVIIDEARNWMNSKADDRYGRSTNVTNLRAMIRKAVEDAFQAEVADAVKAAREAVLDQFGSDVGDRVGAIVREALAKR